MFTNKNEMWSYSINTENNIILKTSITNKSFDYVYNINRTEIKNRYKVKDDYTGESLFSTLKKTYSIEDLDNYTAYSYLVLNRKVELQGDKAYIPITLTYGISEPCVSHIKEKFENNKGFTVSMEPIRHYPNGELASHILGYIGKISQQDEIEKYTKDKGYSSDSFIGKTGVEESQEVSLKGQDGFKKVMVDNRGNRTETISETQAVPGKNVYLSIDSDLQKVAEESLKRTLESIRNGNEYKSKWGSYKPNESHKNATSGAVVVLDVKTGKVLALASYPSYDPNLFVTGISNSDWISLFPEDARDLIYMCPKMEFYDGYTLRQVLKNISNFNSDFDLSYALELCDSFKLDLDKKFKVEENVQNCTIFKTVVTICMNKKYLLFNKPEIGLSSLNIRKLSDILIGNFKRNGYTPIIHSKNVNYFFDYLDYIIIIKDKKVALFESREKLEKMVYSISGSVDLISTAVKDRDVLAIRTLKNFSKLKIA